MSIDIEGVLPVNVSTDVLRIAASDSAVLSLARTVPMPTGVTEMPVQTRRPTAAWVTGPGGRKPVSDFAIETVQMTAEEVAVIIPIPQVYLDDSSINLWNFVRPQLGEAIRAVLDAAVLFGTNAPATFPPNGIVDPAHCETVSAGIDALDTVNIAMATVEAQGLRVNGASADLSVQGALRGIRDANGALLFGPPQGSNTTVVTPFGVPIAYGEYPVGASVNFITGDWSALILGQRQDIRYQLSDNGVIADNDGKVLISAFQDDVVLMRAWARYGCLVVNPPTMRFPSGAKPFAASNIEVPVPPTSGNGGSGGEGGEGGDSGDTRRAGRASARKATTR